MEIEFKFNVLTLVYHELKKTATCAINKRLLKNIAAILAYGKLIP